MAETIVRTCEALMRLLFPPSGRHRPAETANAYPVAERRLRRQWRWALWLAVHGIDVGPRWIHGVKVAAW
ncbi:hypothetical protein ACQUSR_11705 [Streptomyces sp. P1-3]|uniref:hypothetical protein n=1 Tax=Streptomyces sp. P1-3 TaxID=3421658 RepID=UPI003D369324